MGSRKSSGSRLPDEPSFYDHLVFETTRGQDHVRCEIEPGYEKLRLTWWHRAEERLSLALNWVRGLRVVTGGGTDYLIASFRDPHLLDLEFHLKPTIFSVGERLPNARRNQSLHPTTAALVRCGNTGCRGG